MYQNEINEKNWEVSKQLVIEELKVQSLQQEEQEAGFLVYKKGINRDGPEIQAHATYQKFITKLSKSSRFKLTKITVSTNKNNQGFVLGVEGWMDAKAISIRNS